MDMMEWWLLSPSWSLEPWWPRYQSALLCVLQMLHQTPRTIKHSLYYPVKTNSSTTLRRVVWLSCDFAWLCIYKIQNCSTRAQNQSSAPWVLQMQHQTSRTIRFCILVDEIAEPPPPLKPHCKRIIFHLLYSVTFRVGVVVHIGKMKCRTIPTLKVYI